MKITNNLSLLGNTKYENESEGGIILSENHPRPNDSAPNNEILKKTIDNMEAAEEAMHFAKGKELDKIKAKNDRRKESIEGLREEIDGIKKSKINGYIK